MQALAILLLSIAATVGYGIVHDQITVRICPEYFTIGHAPLVQTDSLTLLGLGWGVLGTWWVGVLLGVPLAAACRVGSWPKRSARSLVRPMALLFAVAGTAALVAAVAGHAAASHGLVRLAEPMASRVHAEKHVAFLTDLWAHNASYTAGLAGGVALTIHVLLARRRAAHARKPRIFV